MPRAHEEKGAANNAENLKRKMLRDQVFDRLYRGIISGYFLPGQHLIESELAEKLGVSRTPVREALRKLELQKLVVTSPFKGVMVRQLSLKEAEEVYVVRAKLEGLAARLAAGKASESDIEQLRGWVEKASEVIKQKRWYELADCNNNFHFCIAKASGNSVLLEMLGNLRTFVNLMRVSAWSDPERPWGTLEEHRLILDAIATRDPDQAERSAICHVENSWKAAELWLLAHEEKSQELGFQPTKNNSAAKT